MGQLCCSTTHCKSQGGAICRSSTSFWDPGFMPKSALLLNSERKIHNVEDQAWETRGICEGSAAAKEREEIRSIHGNRKAHRVVVGGENSKWEKILFSGGIQ